MLSISRDITIQLDNGMLFTNFQLNYLQFSLRILINSTKEVINFKKDHKP